MIMLALCKSLGWNSSCIFFFKMSFYLKMDRISFNNSWKLYLRKYLDNYMYEKNIINGFAIYVVYG